MENYNVLSIDLQTIAKNLKYIKSLLPHQTRIMTMVKSAAYGTDAYRLSSFFLSQGIDILGVAHIQEGIFLRNQGIKAPIFVLHGNHDEAKEIAAYDLEVGISDQATLENLAQQNKEIKVHLHIDTGMKRFGCRPEEAVFLAKKIIEEKNLKFEGLMTHFVAAESQIADPFSRKQQKSFQEILSLLKNEKTAPTWIHAQNSSGALRFSMPFCNMVRIGFAPFGYGNPNLIPSLSLKSKIVNINLCKKRESVGYNKSYIAKRDLEKIAIIPLGYYDGLHLYYSGKGFALIRGKKAPFVGKICMDFMMLNVTDIPDVHLGDEVLIFGKDDLGNTLPLEEFASFGKTNPRAVITAIGPRVKRVFHE